MFQKTLYTFIILVMMMTGSGIMAVFAEVPDSTKGIEIKEINVTEKYRNTAIRSINGMQMMQKDEMTKLPAMMLSDALKYLSGINLKDFGGIGGLKTISVRSLGANHTAVSLDGVTVNDVQTGQIDLSHFSLDLLEAVAIHQGQSDQLFQPARNFASGSVLQLQTHFPDLSTENKQSGRVAMKAGSFGLFNPSGHYFLRLNDQWIAGISGEFLYAKGDYPYILKEGADSTVVEKRTNSDIQTIRGEINLRGQLSSSEKLSFKSSFRNTERGLPGATIFYNSQFYSNQRLSEQSFFTQAHYLNRISGFWSVQANAKYSSGYLRYQDPDFMDSSGGLDNIYQQNEYYLSGSVLFQTTKAWLFSASSDVFYQDMHANLEDFIQPGRWSYLQSVQARYSSDQIQASAGYVGTFVNDRAERNQEFVHGSPYIGFSYSPFEKENLLFRLFYKDVFRLPTFNDLYYPMVGNHELKPEKARQFNLGMTLPLQIGEVIHLSITTDVYRNFVLDKIVAFPNKNTFNWTVMNFGKVEITGLDFTGEMKIAFSDKIRLILQSAYTYQRSLDITDPEGRTWNHQLPYTPRVSGSGRLTLENPFVDFTYSLIWSGHRYALIENYAENRLPGFSEHNVSFVKAVQILKKKMQLKFEVLNLWDENYQVVRWFPMPGRNFRIGIEYSF